MGTYWDAFVDEFPRHDGETDRAYLERFYSWLDAFSVPTKHTEHITDLMRQLAEARTIIAQLQGALLAADGATEQAERQRDALKAALEKAREEAEAGKDLAGWAAAIKWNHRERNTEEWLAGLRERIEKVQALAALEAGKEAGG